MSRVEDFLTAEEEKEVVQAIIEAENRTSGEIGAFGSPHPTGNHGARQGVISPIKNGQYPRP